MQDAFQENVDESNFMCPGNNKNGIHTQQIHGQIYVGPITLAYRQYNLGVTKFNRGRGYGSLGPDGSGRR